MIALQKKDTESRKRTKARVRQLRSSKVRIKGWIKPQLDEVVVVKPSLFKTKKRSLHPHNPQRENMAVIASFNAVVDDISAEAVFMSVRSEAGYPVEIAVDRAILPESVQEGDFCKYEILRLGLGRLGHRLRKVAAPGLTPEEKQEISDRVNSLFSGREI